MPGALDRIKRLRTYPGSRIVEAISAVQGLGVPQVIHWLLGSVKGPDYTLSKGAWALFGDESAHGTAGQAYAHKAEVRKRLGELAAAHAVRSSHV